MNIKKLCLSLKENLISPYEPSGVNKNKFHLWNVVLFIFVGLAIVLLRKNGLKVEGNEATYWKIWIAAFVIGILKLCYRNFKYAFRFFLLTIYAQNRTMLVMISVALILVPFEMVMINFSDDYMRNGFSQTSLFIKISGYGYFYFIFLRLFYYFVLKKDSSRGMPIEGQ